MPPKRRNAPSRTASQQAQQSTLSFAGKNSKVTKPSTPQQEKAAKKDPALVEDVARAELETPQAAEIEDIKDETTAETAIADQTDHEASLLEPAQDATGAQTKTEDILGGRAQPSDEGAVGGTGSGWLGDEENEARKVKDAQIKKYWRVKEEARLAPRVHQEDLTVGEKILREWDMSGQYGPCIGIARLKRWKRANVLGLNPPIEVLAVLLTQMDEGDHKSQRAHVDELMSSRFVET
ncbi:hypothetical protein MBLNU230_g1700t1 [Neophaeotheca triangularis]